MLDCAGLTIPEIERRFLGRPEPPAPGEVAALEARISPASIWRRAVIVAALRVEWQKEWNSGNRTIDLQHQEIIALGNSLLDLTQSKGRQAGIRKAIETLIVAIQKHFADEESIIRDSGFPDTEHHCQIHRGLYAEAREMQESYLKGKTEAPILYDFIVHKLILDHILTTDVLYYPYVRGRQNGREVRA